jgi:hypothetical protein
MFLHENHVENVLSFACVWMHTLRRARASPRHRFLRLRAKTWHFFENSAKREARQVSKAKTGAPYYIFASRLDDDWMKNHHPIDLLLHYYYSS